MSTSENIYEADTVQIYALRRDHFRVDLYHGAIKRAAKLFIELDSLTGKEYIDSYIKILHEVLPRLPQTDVQAEKSNTIVMITEIDNINNNNSEVKDVS